MCTKMSGICSRHQTYHHDCPLCNVDIRQVLPDYDKKHAEAVAAGTTVCKKCGFKYYLTTDICPKCGEPYNGVSA